MEGKRMINGGGDAQNLPKKLKISSHDQPLDYIFGSGSSNSFMGSRTMFSFGPVGGVNKTGNSFYQSFDQEEIGDEYLDEYLNQPEKKRRLSIEQVQFLEQNFETENKLEPDRKIQLAKELGLQPRQIAIWFQNRRARWKTKQLETDYETLHDSYERLKSDYSSLLKENEKLKAEVLNLKDNGQAKDIETSNIESLDNKELMSESIPKQTTVDMISEDEESNVSAVVFKNKEQVSAKSDLTDVDSSHLIDGIGSSLLQSGDNYNFFETDRSDLSQNEEDNLNLELLQPAYIFPKMDGTYLIPAENSCYYRFPVEDPPFGFWSY